MPDVSDEKLKAAIEELLENSDLSTISAKKVRQQLEKKFKTDFTERKKEIDAMVMDYVNSQESEEEAPSESEGESEPESGSDSEQKKKPARKAAPKRKSNGTDEDDEDDAPKNNKSKEVSGSDSDSEPLKKTPRKAAPKRRRKNDDDNEFGSKTKTKKGKDGRGKNSGYTKAYQLSPALSDLMGEQKMPRHEVVRRVWALIKERNLYDPKNKQFAICDDALYKVIGTKRFRTFGMMKYLKTHFYND